MKDFKKVSETDGEVLDTIDYSVEELYTKAMKGEFSPMTQAAIARLYFEILRGGIEL
ncbi:MAG: hypothetical protein R3B60_00825 [Candidatus Paceibacterota bacterium]